jgi:hypothetical protein
LRFLVRLIPKGEGDPAFLSTVRSLAKSVLAEARNPKWTSYRALEIDIFVPSAGDFSLFLATVEPLARIEFTKNLSEAPPHKPKNELIEEARAYFNSERYWEAHETLEAVWRNATGEEKRYLQGLILVCAAFVHHQKGEDGVALGVLNRAAKQLFHEGDSYHGIDSESLKNRVDHVLGVGRFEAFRI